MEIEKSTKHQRQNKKNFYLKLKALETPHEFTQQIRQVGLFLGQG
jgi:acetylornithine/succinyldiaminopimelate/putrescine aminotransferase